MFQDTRPAALDADRRHAEFLVEHPRERLALLRRLRDAGVPVQLASPDGAMLASSLWAIDEERARLSLSVDPGDPRLEALLADDETVAVAYLEAVKLQFDLHGLVLVRGSGSAVLQALLPQRLYRFQRRASYRVRTLPQLAPTARLRHPQIAEMALALRVLDVSLGGCSLLLPADVPPLEPGLKLAGVQVELDADTRFVATLALQHVSALAPSPNLRLGCEWAPLAGASERVLQRWIEHAQRRRRLLSLG